MPERNSANSIRRAVLIFADSLAKDLSRRGWSRELSALLRVPSLDPSNLDADVHLFGPRRQRGSSFGERLSNAIDDLTQLGYDQVVIVGRDCPQLSSQDISEAFARLPESRAVLGPDHRGGCYLIGIHTSDREILKSIRWQQNTDFAEIVTRIGADRVAVLPVKIDLDSTEDIRFLNWSIDLPPVPIYESAGNITSKRTAVRQRWQIPPPAILSSACAA